MGNQEDSTSKSDSGYGDDAPPPAPDANQNHPLTLKGYDVATAATLQVGDVFEFLWADAHEYQWEWKCLGYVRFIVLRHTDTFPHYAACVPISVGSKGMNDFTKPGIDHLQQGFVFADGERNPGVQPPRGGRPLPYSPVGIELKPGKFRVSHDSRANYADIVEVDHDAEIMVVGTVSRYFDRLRRNVNRAVMRQILRKSLEEYCERKARGSTLDLRSKTVEANPSRFHSREDNIAEERSEDELPPDEPAQNDAPLTEKNDEEVRVRHDEAVAGLEEQPRKPHSDEANNVLEDSDEFDERRHQQDHLHRHRSTRRTSRSSRHSREIKPVEDDAEKPDSRPNWFRRLSSRLLEDKDKDKGKEHYEDWSHYVTHASHRRSTSLETQTGIAISSSRQSSPRRPRRQYTNEMSETRIGENPRSVLDMAVAGRRRPNSSGE